MSNLSKAANGKSHTKSTQRPRRGRHSQQLDGRVAAINDAGHQLPMRRRESDGHATPLVSGTSDPSGTPQTHACYRRHHGCRRALAPADRSLRRERWRILCERGAQKTRRVSMKRPHRRTTRSTDLRPHSTPATEQRQRRSKPTRALYTLTAVARPADVARPCVGGRDDREAAYGFPI